MQPAASLEEEFPEVATYLESVTSTTGSTPARDTNTNSMPSQHAQNQASEELTMELIQGVQDIMQRAEAEGKDPNAELRALVSRTVIQGVATGYEMSADTSERRDTDDDVREREGLHGAKRSRTDDSHGPQ
jgi:uncharacterized protein